MDEFLDSQGLWRKHIPKDGTCLFRAVSETIFHCQAYHLNVRQDCVQYLRKRRDFFHGFVDGDYDVYLDNVANPKVWAGLVELSALSLMYRHDFLVYQEVGQPPTPFTKNNFEKTILLVYSQGNHYDLVYRKEQLDVMAYCQALVYGLLYQDVFKLGEDVDYAVQKMLYDKAYSKKKKSLSLPYLRNIEERRDKCRIKEIDEENPKGEAHSEIREMLAQGCPPFPYKVAKALDHGIYRNVEFDRWNQARREQERAEQLVVPDFAPGVKCLVRLMENQTFHAHIQEMSPDHGPVTVFVEELGEKKIIPFDHLQPLAIPVYKALAMQGFSCKKSSIRFLDGCLKNSPLVSLSSIVAEGFRGSKKYLKKKAKDFSFLLNMTEKHQAICWSSNVTNQSVSSSSSPTKKAPPRYLNEKMKMIPETAPGNGEKMIKGNQPEASVDKVLYSSSVPQQAKLPQALGYSVSSYVPPLQGTLPPGLDRANPPIQTTPAFSPMVPGNSLAFPIMPYGFLGPTQANTNGPATDFVMDPSTLFNTGLSVDGYGNPYFYTFGTCEVPYLLPPVDRAVRATANGGIMNIGASVETVQSSSTTTSASLAAPVPPQTGSFWTYNGSITYLSAPVDGCDWTVSDETAAGFQHVPAGMPFLFFVAPTPGPPMAPAPMTPGVIMPQGSFVPAVTNV